MIYYVTDEKEQSQKYINMFRKESLDAVYMQDTASAAHLSASWSRSMRIEIPAY